MPRRHEQEPTPTHEVLRPFDGPQGPFKRGDLVDATFWTTTKSLENMRMIRPLPPPSPEAAGRQALSRVEAGRAELDLEEKALHDEADAITVLQEAGRRRLAEIEKLVAEKEQITAELRAHEIRRSTIRRKLDDELPRRREQLDDQHEHGGMLLRAAGVAS